MGLVCKQLQYADAAFIKLAAVLNAEDKKAAEEAAAAAAVERGEILPLLRRRANETDNAAMTKFNFGSSLCVLPFGPLRMVQANATAAAEQPRAAAMRARARSRSRPASGPPSGE
jgi:hypothetical protein